MNTRRKGTAKRTEIKKWLETLGWEVDVVEKTGKFQKIKDLFGLFDLEAIKSPGIITYVQVTCTNPHKHNPYVLFKQKYPNFEVWQVIITKGNWKKIYIYGRNGGYHVKYY